MAQVIKTENEPVEVVQDYLHDFNKNTDDAQQAGQSNSGAASAENEFYTIDGQKLSGNIASLIADQGDNAAIMVMNENGDNQYMLIVQGGDEQGDEQNQTLVAVANDQEIQQQIQDASEDVQTPAKRTRSTLRNKTRIKREVFDEDAPNDMSVYDFNDLNMPNNRAGAAALSSSLNLEKDSTMDDDLDDSDYKTPIIQRQRAARSATVPTKKTRSSANDALNKTSGNIGTGLHVCTYCTYTSTKRYLLSRHMKSHSEDRPHKCGICERGFKTLASLQNHVNTHTGVRPHQCKFCEAAFTTSGELVRHIRYRHTHEKPHRCPDCDYASVELSKLKRHMRCHTGERPYQCQHCTYASPDTYKLKRHLRIHTGEKPYACDICNQRFTQSNSLKAHRLIHTGNKPVFQCDYCPTTCGRKTDLRIHVQKLHSSDRILTCKRCDQCFPDRYQFKMHLKTHEGEKCFKCDLCSYASVSARHLESHMLIHTDLKPFICDECHSKFRQKQLLRRHKNLYHTPNYVHPTPKEKTHECAQCSKTFRHKGNLIRHMTLHDTDVKRVKVENGSHMDNTQLIDDEVYEGETDEEEMEETFDDPSVSMMSEDGSSMFEGAGTVNPDGSITLVSDTHQLINPNGGDQVMLLVQCPEGSEASAGTSHFSAPNEEQSTLVAVANPVYTTPRIISRNARITRTGKSSKANALFDSENDIKPNMDQSANSFDDVGDRLQKQKDMDSCFGFKDEDDEDDIILSMPAIHGQ